MCPASRALPVRWSRPVVLMHVSTSEVFVARAHAHGGAQALEAAEYESNTCQNAAHRSGGRSLISLQFQPTPACARPAWAHVRISAPSASCALSQGCSSAVSSCQIHRCWSWAPRARTKAEAGATCTASKLATTAPRGAEARRWTAWLSDCTRSLLGYSSNMHHHIAGCCKGVHVRASSQAHPQDRRRYPHQCTWPCVSLASRV